MSKDWYKKMSKQEWDSTHKDFKMVKEGEKYIMIMSDKGSVMFPVIIIKN